MTDVKHDFAAREALVDRRIVLAPDGITVVAIAPAAPGARQSVGEAGGYWHTPCHFLS